MEHFSPNVKRALYLPGERLDYEDVNEIGALVAATPFSPAPFQNWAGFKLNSKGFRTHEYQVDKALGVCRIVALGDSFTFDSGFVPWDGMWHAILGRDLQAKLGRRVEVLNLGVPSVGPRFARRLFEIEGARLSPDLVILALFVGNDVTDECGPRGSLMRRYSTTWRLITRLPLLIRDLASQYGAEPPTGPGGFPVPAREYDAESPINDDQTLARIVADTAELFRAENKFKVQRCIDDLVGVVAGMSRQVAATDSQFMVVLIPDQIQVQPYRLETKWHINAVDLDLEWVQQKLTAGLRGNAVKVIDLLPDLRNAAATGERLYRRGDTHWSLSGNRVAARALLDASVSIVSNMQCLRRDVTQ